MEYAKELLDRYEKQIQMKRKSIDSALERKGSVIAPGIVQYEFDGFEDLYRHVNPFVKPLCLQEYIFRGHSHKDYKLLPTVKRNPTSETGSSFRREFELLAKFADKLSRRNLFLPNGGQYFLRPAEFVGMLETWIPLETLDFVAYARHAGMETRMLDWTYDIWTALYFAASGVLDEVRKKIERGTSPKDIALNPEDRMVLWLFNIRQWKELTDPMAPIHPYGAFYSNLHFTMPYYYDNANAHAQKGLLSYFSVKKENIMRETPMEVIDDWERATATSNDNYTVDAYIAKGYEFFLEKTASPYIPIMFKFTLPLRAALEAVDSLILLGYTHSSIYPNAENCVKDLQFEDDYMVLKEIFGR